MQMRGRVNSGEEAQAIYLLGRQPLREEQPGHSQEAARTTTTLTVPALMLEKR